MRKMPALSACIVAVLLLLSPFISAEAYFCKLSTIDQKELTGTLTFDGKTFFITDKGKPTQLKPLQVEKIDYGSTRQMPEEPTQAVVYLRNGDRLEGLFANLQDSEHIALSLPEIGLLSIPFEEAMGIYFLGDTRSSRMERALFEAMLEFDSEMDEVGLLNGDTFSGILLDIGGDGVKFEQNEKELLFGREKLKYAFFAGNDERKRTSKWYAEVSTTFGNTYTIVLSCIDEKNLSGETLLGAEISISMESVLLIVFKNGAIRHLSDFEPFEVLYKPYYYKTWKYRKNRSVNGAFLRVNGRRYSRGFGTHSYTSLAFSLEHKYIRFTAIVGIDDETIGKGRVNFLVLGDGKKLFDSGVMQAMKSKEVNIVVRGVNTLVLVTDFGGNDDLSDHADWCMPKLVSNIDQIKAEAEEPKKID